MKEFATIGLDEELPRDDQCTIAGCTKGRDKKSWWCSMHRSRNRSHGTPFWEPPPERKCVISGCDQKHHGHGLCMRHYDRNRRYGDPLHVLPPPKVSVAGGSMNPDNVELVLSTRHPVTDLTNAEREEVSRLLTGRGKSIAEIAYRLGVTPRTISRYREDDRK